MLRIRDIKIKKDISDEEVFLVAIHSSHINIEDVTNWYISKKSIDARKKDDICYIYSIDITLKNENKYPKLEKVTNFQMPEIRVNRTSTVSPVIVGSGPARTFCCTYSCTKWN